MNLTGRQLGALMYVAKEVINVDGDVADEESTVFSNVFSQFGMTTEQVRLLLNAATEAGPEAAIEIITNLGEEQKTFASALVTMLVASDGQLEDEELEIYSNLLKVCQLPYLTIDQAIKVLE